MIIEFFLCIIIFLTAFSAMREPLFESKDKIENQLNHYLKKE
jgi:hypothetical protein